MSCTSQWRLTWTVAITATAIAALPARASAHCFVGARFLPATLNTDDPCVADEMSLPTIAWSRTADVPAASEVDISAELAKRITESFGIVIGETWSQIRQPGGPTLAGFNNLETAFQYQLIKDGPHELAAMAGLILEWGGTGATNSGLADSFSTLSPTVYVGKGFGELPDSLNWARPFAATFEASYNVPTRSYDPVAAAFIPQTVSYSGSLQYSLPYLHANVVDLGLPDFFNHLIPIVEANFQTPVANNRGTSFVTTGFIDPGVILVGPDFQIGVEALIPINPESGSGVGVLGQLHLYLDDMFPTTLGRPLIGGGTQPAKPAGG